MTQERVHYDEREEFAILSGLPNAISHEAKPFSGAVHSIGPLGNDIDNPPPDIGHLIPVDQNESETDQRLGRWPKRLLHVPSMTSFEWQPGNWYGGVVEPRYNAISYTWGRFRLDRKLKTGNKKFVKKYRAVQPVNIRGVTWDIPKILPEHFTSDDFHRAIIAACQPRSQDEEGVEFLWLDIACIHQADAAENAIEVGRQAKIFRNAETVYAWLAKHRTGKLREILDGFAKKVRNMCEEYSGDYARFYSSRGSSFESRSLAPQVPTIFDISLQGIQKITGESSVSIQRYVPLLQPLQEIAESLGALFVEPWFSSLWTLQESYLSPCAVFLSREGDRGTATSISDSCGDLQSLISTCSRLSTVCNDVLVDNVLREELRVQRLLQERGYNDQAGYPPDHWTVRLTNIVTEILGLIDTSGISALASGSPFALLGIAGRRTASRDTDHVYGIQQVFQLRLGQSAVSSPPGTKYSRWILENQLGAELLRRQPVLSQMFIAMTKTQLGGNWRISTGSRIPKLHILSNLHDLEYNCLCGLSVKYANRRWWACFDGKTCSFKTLSDSWAAMDSTVGSPVPPHSLYPSIPSVYELALDSYVKSSGEEFYAEIGPATTDYGIWAAARALPQDQEYQRRYAWWVINCYKDDDIHVLLLGSFEDHERDLEKATVIENKFYGMGGPERLTKYHVGLILVRERNTENVFKGLPEQPWKRVGFCIWKVDSRRIDTKVNAGPADFGQHLRILRANDEQGHWQRHTGHYG